MRSGLNHRSIGGSWFAGWTALLVSSVIALAGPAPIPVLMRSDVVFMYEAPGEIYEAYGATMLAWGGAPRAKSAEQTAGLKYFGSLGMVTEFSRYCDRFPSNYQEGLCRDLKGQPFKVPWLRAISTRVFLTGGAVRASRFFDNTSRSAWWRSLEQAALYNEVKDILNTSALELSLGQQQRLCIARAVAIQPEVILMDEPASALDPIATLKIEELIAG